MRSFIGCSIACSLMLASACSDDGDARRAGADAAPGDGSMMADAGADATDHDADAGTDAGPTTLVSHARELRAAWVATVYGLDWPSGTGISAAEQRVELIAILDRLAALRMNAIVFQIRPESDALYASTLEPWSRFLTGTQGADPGWDPLAELVSEAHARGIEVHAWMNPYRGLTSASVAAAPNHVTQTLSEHALGYNGMLWMDPGAPKVRAHVVSVVSDVVARYDVDGIHFDDYFYPYPDAAGTDFPDQPSYDAYLSAGGALERGDWRRSNVHLLIEAVASAVSGSKPWVRFGVSPFGIYRPGVPEGIQGLDAYATIYCDPLEWVTQGWVDYLAPQLYWPTTQTAQAYGTLLPWWASTCSGKAWIFAGNSLSKLGTSSAWTAAEIEEQVLITRSQRDAGALGNVFFRMQQLANDLDGVASALAEKLYLAPALPPPLFTAVDQIVAPPLVDASGGAVTLSHPEPGSLRAWSVYREVGAAYELDRLVPATTISFVLDPGNWAIAAVARSDAESRGRLVTIE